MNTRNVRIYCARLQTEKTLSRHIVSFTLTMYATTRARYECDCSRLAYPRVCAVENAPMLSVAVLCAERESTQPFAPIRLWRVDVCGYCAGMFTWWLL